MTEGLYNREGGLPCVGYGRYCECQGWIRSIGMPEAQWIHIPTQGWPLGREIKYCIECLWLGGTLLFHSWFLGKIHWKYTCLCVNLSLYLNVQ